jgi:hypothetical protein
MDVVDKMGGNVKNSGMRCICLKVFFMKPFPQKDAALPPAENMPEIENLFS